MGKQYKDEDGKPVKAGDTIVFGYGIPCVRVEGPVFERNGKLWVSTPGHKPAEATLGQVIKHCGGFVVLPARPTPPETPCSPPARTTDMSETFNKLTPAEAERLAMLMEEAGEVIQACGKILRHGYQSTNPHNKSAGSNRQHLAKEVRDIEAVITMMRENFDLEGTVTEPIGTVIVGKLRYTHHQMRDHGHE